MDPKACIERAWAAFYDGDREECRAALDDYRAWRARGGFDPELHPGEGPAGDRAADACERSLAALPPEPTHYAERIGAEDGRRIW